MVRPKKVAGFAAILVALGGLCWFVDRQMARSNLETARREMAMGWYVSALKRLVDLSSRFQIDDAVWLARGDCEDALGQTSKAVESWSKIVDGSSESGEVDFRLGSIYQGKGRLAQAEERFSCALRHPGSHQQNARRRLITVLKYQGRIREVRSLIQADWQSGSSPVDVIRELWEIDYTVYPIEGVRNFLDRAGKSLPNDDRIWLARANLATRLGEFDEAEKWLNKCRQVRPDDPAVWQSRLEWALAADRMDAAAEPLARIVASSWNEDDIQALRARFAASRRDTKTERDALLKQLAGDLHDSRPINRLAELATLDGDRETAARLQARSLDFEKARDSYMTTLGLDDPAPKARELASLAERLGRRFEARAWWIFAALRSPELQAEANSRLESLVVKPVVRPTTTRLADCVDAGPISETVHSSGLLIPRFVDDADKAGLRFTFDNGRTDSRQLPETTSGGVGLLDYDGDGLMDVYALQGGKFPPDPAGRNLDRLFRNLGQGQFQDVTESTGLAGFPGGYSHGIAVGDIDNDGDPDLFVTRWRSYALYRNQGNGTFEDITQPAGLDGDRDWPTSAAFADLDNDGDLDLFVCHYLVWDVNDPLPCPQDEPKQRFYCYPRLFQALPDRLYRNDNGRFIDVTPTSGIVDRDGRGLGVVAGDFDEDGLVDLYVANDATANFYFHNQGGLKFEEIAATAGNATNGSGSYQAGMGVASGDQNGDGLMDLAVTNFYAEGTTLFASIEKNLYFDHSLQVGLATTSRNYLGFGVAFLDANDDGWLDLATANGHVNDGRPRLPYAMPARLFLGNSRYKLADLSSQSGEPWQVARVGRALATGDLDNDGRTDLVIVSEGEPLAYFHNLTEARGHFVTFQLEGRASNRDAVGARVKVKVGGRTQVNQRLGGGSFQSASDPRLHFGLGSATRVEWVEVTWPSGKVDRWTDLPADKGYRLRESEAQALPLQAFPH